MAKQNKPRKVEEAVNPIVFNCNLLTDKRAEFVMGKHLNPIVMDTLKDKAKLYKFRRLKILPLAIHYYEKFKDVPGYVPVELGDVLGCPINSYLCDAYIYPSPRCRIRKLSERATQFLLSLGAPTDELRMEYRKYLSDSADASISEEVHPGITSGFFEELLEIPINGHTEYIYVLSSPEMCYVVHRRDPKVGENEFFNIPVHRTMRDKEMIGPTLEYDAKYDNPTTGNLFDVEALLANLWIAENLHTCEPCMEPEWSRHATDRLVIASGKKPLKHSQAYRYIHITDEVWKKYEDGLKNVRECKNFSVPSWFVRAHYARMHGKTVLVKAHYAYRRKGIVNTAEPVDYIV